MSRRSSNGKKSETLVFAADAALVRELRVVAHTRRQSPEALLAQLVADGLSKQAAREMLEDRLRNLTRREREVLGLIVEGQSNRQIAARLVVVPETVKSHVKHILEKVGVNSKTNLRLMLLDLGVRVWE